MFKFPNVDEVIDQPVERAYMIKKMVATFLIMQATGESLSWAKEAYSLNFPDDGCSPGELGRFIKEYYKGEAIGF